MSTKPKIDKVRASRDGHEYHELWVARKALQLLWPSSELNAIAVEGTSPADRSLVSAQTVEIADVILYYGKGSSFKRASRTSFAQFKYSIASQESAFRVSDAKTTIEKFSFAYQELQKEFGDRAVQDRLDFQLITNQPIYQSFLQAVEAIATSRPVSGEVEKQAKQFQRAAGLEGKALINFAEKFKVIGRTGSLPASKRELASLLVDWSATSDPISAARLGQLKELVREKAGFAGTDRNLITRTEVLSVLEVGDPSDLLPCMAALADVGHILEREQLSDTVSRISTLSAPLLIHATGGIGKTVFMDSLEKKLSPCYETVFFDCFGGGAYRSREDARHLPRQGLVHIANTLAFRGLCDPILPGSPDVESLLRTFRRRIKQCLTTLSRNAPGRGLAIFIDAIDNAELVAEQRSEDCFPILLLESLDTEPIAGLRVILSCRTERKPKTYAKYQELGLLPFSLGETRSFLKERLKKVSEVEVSVALARSRGNARVIAHLIASGRGLLDKSEIDKPIELDELIRSRIFDALRAATERGYSRSDTDAFLAGLAVLPPPVPLEEYAGAHGISLEAIESFASDLSPLLECSNQGLMFRDEPTETLVHKQYASSKEALRRVADNLLARQETSVYAARALPGLLHQLDDSDQLFALAFDKRLPKSITSAVGKRNVRYARLRAATLHAALKRDSNKLVHLLLELSTIASVDQRGAEYILDSPDLVIAAKDVDATRRLFESRPNWPGARHARLTIANVLAGERNEASRHAVATDEWLEHYRRNYSEDKYDESRPEQVDIAAVPFFLISVSREKDAARFLERWLDWYTYEVCERVYSLHSILELTRPPSFGGMDKFLKEVSGIGPLAATVSFLNLSRPKLKDTIERLAYACGKPLKLPKSRSYRRIRAYQLEDGLRKASVLALTFDLKSEALKITKKLPSQRPRLWSFREPFYSEEIFNFVFQEAIACAAKGVAVGAKRLLPQELFLICPRLSNSLDIDQFREQAKLRLSKIPRRAAEEKDDKKLSYEESQEAERFLNYRLEPLFRLANALRVVIAAPARGVEKAFVSLVGAWEEARRNRSPYQTGEIDPFFWRLGYDTLIFCLWTRHELGPVSVERLLGSMQAQAVSASDLIKIVSILARRQKLHELASLQAQAARSAINSENDVVQRASHFSSLARALLPVCLEEASAYFREGLDQMDAIGSGDYQFTNELLLFASSIKGGEIEERDFHTLSNICELNMGDEPEKFYWGAYGRGLSKAAGVRGLAKLSRWDDRGRISLGNTLLPYLTALVEDGKLSPKDAISLNYLANPVEYFYAGTAEFAKAIGESDRADEKAINSLISQFLDDNPDIPSKSTLTVLAELSQKYLGGNPELTDYLFRAQEHYGNIRDVLNDNRNHRPFSDKGVKSRIALANREGRRMLVKVIAATDPVVSISISKAITDLASLQNGFDFKEDLFSALRSKLPFNSRSKYIKLISELDNLPFYWKLSELKTCKELWSGSSVSLRQSLKEIGRPLVRLHSQDLISHGSLSGSSLKDISELSDVPMHDLVLDLIKDFSRPDTHISGSVWLAFSSFICPQAESGQGQLALKRLLSSEASQLADSVPDGPWIEGLYPNEDVTGILAGMVWRSLGSPSAEDRWRAAYSIKSFADFGRWDVIEAIFSKFNHADAGPFQANELSFYYLHAQLWLLMAVARISIEFPEQISRLKAPLLSIASEESKPHVLIRNFAARALLTCVNSGSLDLPADTIHKLTTINSSPFPQETEKKRGHSNFYNGRPNSAPRVRHEFHLDYEFNKHDVDNLSRVFGKPCWEVADLVGSIAREIAPQVASMHESGGRESRRQRGQYGMSTSYHTLGEHLGWHALFLAAGNLLARFPVTNDWWYEEDPLGEWMSRYLPTRSDGFWLSDGTDKTPLDVADALIEVGGKSPAVTGNQQKLLQLVGIGKGIKDELVVNGNWHSSDGVRVQITSALVLRDKATSFVRKLIREKPFHAWLPVINGIDDGGFIDKKWAGCMPWIVCPSGETRLDEHDPFGTQNAILRPFLSESLTSFYKITRTDNFGRIWSNGRGNTVLHAQAWGREVKREGDFSGGIRLYCKSKFLKKILSDHECDLLILINLQRYEKKHLGESSFTHSIGVVKVDETLSFQYFKGRTNHVLKSEF